MDPNSELELDYEYDSTEDYDDEPPERSAPDQKEAGVLTATDLKDEQNERSGTDCKDEPPERSAPDQKDEQNERSGTDCKDEPPERSAPDQKEEAVVQTGTDSKEADVRTAMDFEEAGVRTAMDFKEEAVVQTGTDSKEAGVRTAMDFKEEAGLRTATDLKETGELSYTDSKDVQGDWLDIDITDDPDDWLHLDFDELGERPKTGFKDKRGEQSETGCEDKTRTEVEADRDAEPRTEAEARRDDEPLMQADTGRDDVLSEITELDYDDFPWELPETDKEDCAMETPETEDRERSWTSSDKTDGRHGTEAAQKDAGPATLTVERLQEHDGSVGNFSKPADDSLDHLSVGETDGDETVDSASTLASVLTMNKLLTKWNPSSALHKEMLAMYSATTEIIKTKGGQETDTEYFAVLGSTLATVDNVISRTSAAGLLVIYANRVPLAVLRKKFSWITTMCMNLIEHYTNCGHILLIRNLLSLVATCLKSLELASWNESSTRQVFAFMCPFIIHTKPRLRKYAHKALRSVLSDSCVMNGPNAPTTHPAIPWVTAFCIQVIRSSTTTSVPISTLHVFGFLKMALPLCSQPEVKPLCEAMLEIMGAGHPTVVHTGMRTLRSFFASKPSPSVTLSPELNAQLVNALYDYKPGMRDTKQIEVWLDTMRSALMNLQSLSDELFLHNLPKFVGIAVDCWQHGKPEIYDTTKCVLSTLLLTSFRACLENEVDSTSQTSLCYIAGTKVVGYLEQALHFRFASAWVPVVNTWSTVFEVMGKLCPDVLMEPLHVIASMHGSQAFNRDVIVELAVGAAIKAMGPELVLKAYPLQMAGEDGGQDFSRSWMLPVLRDRVSCTRLAFFTTYFLPLASAFHESAETFLEKSPPLAKTYDLLEKQIWSLLPGFCTEPTDLEESFPRIAKTLGNYLVSRADLRLPIMSALRHLIDTSVGNEENVGEIKKYSKNFLPILFNIYTTKATSSHGEGVRLATYDTIKAFIGITDEQLCCTLFSSASAKLSTEDLSTFTKQAILDLGRALIPKIGAEHIQRLYQFGNFHLEDPDRTVQKKAYRVVEEICKCSTPACKNFVAEALPELQGTLLDTFKSVSPGSRAPRLRCFTLVLENLEAEQKEFAMKVLQEAVLNIRVNATKVREAAYEVVLSVGRALIRWKPLEPSVAMLVDHLTAGLIGSSYAISCTIMALATVLYEFKGNYNSEVLFNVMEAVQIVISSSDREIVQAALHFVRMLFMILSTEELSKHVDTLVPNLFSLSEDCQKHFRLKVRDILTRLIRKIGYENIAPHLPASFRKFASNIRKVEERKKRQRERSRELSSEDEGDGAGRVAVGRGTTAGIAEILQDSSEDESEDDSADKSRRKKRTAAPVWIEEQGEDDIVDFLDTSAGQQITSTNPKALPKIRSKCPFEIGKDGRLIIGDPESAKKKEDSSDVEEVANDVLEVLSHYKSLKRKAERSLDAGEGTSKMATAAGPPKKRKVDKASDGDARKGNLEPYAYLPLSRTSLNKRFKKNPQVFKKLLWAAQKGAKKGKKAARINKKV